MRKPTPWWPLATVMLACLAFGGMAGAHYADTDPATVASTCTVQTLRSEHRVRGVLTDIRETVRNVAKSAEHLEAIEAALAKHRSVPGYWATTVARGDQ